MHVYHLKTDDCSDHVNSTFGYNSLRNEETFIRDSETRASELLENLECSLVECLRISGNDE